jgi:hypothetical protein
MHDARSMTIVPSHRNELNFMQSTPFDVSRIDVVEKSLLFERRELIEVFSIDNETGLVKTVKVGSDGHQESSSIRSKGEARQKYG